MYLQEPTSGPYTRPDDSVHALYCQLSLSYLGAQMYNMIYIILR